MDEQTMLVRARAGDREAMSQIVIQEQRVVRSYLARLAPDPATADDLAQEVFLVAFRSLDRVDPGRGLRGYLLGIARNLSRAAWRQLSRRREVGGEALMLVLEARVDLQDSDADDQRLESLRRCLQRLSPRALMVVLQHYRDQLGCDEIAQEAKLASGTVRSLLMRSRAALRQCIDRNATVAT